MADTYTYKVRDRAGKVLEGSIEADSTKLVAERLRSMGYVPIAIDRKSNTGMKKELHIPGLGNRVKMKDIAVFSRQFATMINSGLTLLRSLTILAGQTENKVLADMLDQVRADVEKGASLSQALARHPKAFNRLYVAMVKAGETGGVLDSVLLQLSTTIEKQVELRRKIKSAMTYPVVVFALVILIVSAMLLFVVPMFSKLYAQLGGGLPAPTKMLMSASNAVTNYWWMLIGGEGGMVFAFRKWIKTPTG